MHYRHWTWAGAVVAVILATGSLAAQYTASAITNDYASHDITATGTPLITSSNQTDLVPFPSGFQFPFFFGELHDDVWVCSNGFLGFGPTSPGSTSGTPASIPLSNAPNNVIFACHTNLRADTVGNGIWTERLSAPDRFVIHYLTEHSTSGVGRADFVVVLYPDGTIEVHFGPTTDWNAPPPGIFGAPVAGMGVENDDGTVGVEAPGGFRREPAPSLAFRYELTPIDFDVYEMFTVPAEPVIGQNDVVVVIANHGTSPFTGNVTVEYTVSAGVSYSSSPVSQVVPLTGLAPGARQVVTFTGPQAWEITGHAHYTLRGAINPQVAGDPDPVDELAQLSTFPIGAHYVTPTILNNYGGYDIAASGTAMAFTGSNQTQFVSFPSGFEFPFYGDLWDGVWIGTNGTLVFGETGNSSSTVPASIPLTGAPNNVIFACRTNLRVDLGAGTGVWWELSPNQFVILYLAEHNTSGAGRVDFAVVLSDDGTIEVHFGPATNLSGTGSVMPAIGIENADGTQGVEAPGGARQLPTPGTAFRWELPATDLDVELVEVVQSAANPVLVGGAYDVRVVIANNSLMPFSGTVNIEYSINSGTPQTQAVPVSNLPTGGRESVLFTGGQAWDVATGGEHEIRGAINPPVAGDPDFLDEKTTAWTVGYGLSTAPWSTRIFSVAETFNGRIWILGGYGSGNLNDVWSSADGVNWVQETAAAAWPARNGHTSAVFDNKLWVLGGDTTGSVGVTNDVWSSDDGVSWTQVTASAPWPARQRHTSATFDGRLWVFGGSDGGGILNDVWSSTDGANWTQEPNASWPARTESHPRAPVFDGRIWMLSGAVYSASNPFAPPLNDVWSTADGIAWTEQTPSAPWIGRRFHTAESFNSRLWIIGGDAVFGENPTDLWSSSDGTNWTLETASPQWGVRYWHMSAIFDNRLYILGGRTTNAAGAVIQTTEVWVYSEDEIPRITSSPPTTASVGNLYTYDIIASGEPAPSFSAIGLPSWLTLTGNTLSGTPDFGDAGPTGNITITAQNRAGSNDQVFTITVDILPPSVSSVAPDPVEPGAQLTISGSNLGGAVSVTVGGISVNIDSNTNTEIVVDIDAGHPVGGGQVVEIVTPGGTDGSATVDVFPPPPSVTSVSPNPVRQGETLIINGANLLPVNSVTIGGTAASVQTVSTATQLRVTIASDHPPGGNLVIEVTAPGGTDSSATVTVEEFTPPSPPSSDGDSSGCGAQRTGARAGIMLLVLFFLAALRAARFRRTT